MYPGSPEPGADSLGVAGVGGRFRSSTCFLFPNGNHHHRVQFRVFGR